MSKVTANFEYIYVTIPAKYVCTYYRILSMMTDFGVDMLNDCKASCTNRNTKVIECFNMFNAAVAAHRLEKDKLAETLVKYVNAKINQIYKIKGAEHVKFPIDENGTRVAYVTCDKECKIELFDAIQPDPEPSPSKPGDPLISFIDYNVVITSDSNVAAIVYTLDGSEPSLNNGKVYTEPFKPTDDCVIKAIAIGINGLLSNLTYKTYIAQKEPVYYSITKTCYNCTLTGVTNIIENGSFTGVLTPVQGYKLPSSITVTGATSDQIHYDNSTGTIVIDNIKNHIVIIANAVLIEVPITPAISIFNYLVSITTATQNAIIKYTTNGVNPTLNIGTVYSEPFSLDTDATIKAIAIKDGVVSNVATAQYEAVKINYSITKNLSNCTINNNTNSIVEGSSYTAKVTANTGYTLQTVNVTMGGVNVPVSNGEINISSVTGNIEITATATKIPEPSVEYNYYVGQIDGSSDEFAAQTSDTLKNNAIKKTESLVDETVVTKRIYYFMIPSGYNFINLQFTDSGLTSNFNSLSELDATTHEPVTIDGTVYNVYAYRIRPNNLTYKLTLSK